MRIIISLSLSFVFFMTQSWAQDHKATERTEEIPSESFRAAVDKSSVKRKATVSKINNPQLKSASSSQNNTTSTTQRYSTPADKSRIAYPKEAYQLLGIDPSSSAVDYKAAKQKLYNNNYDAFVRLVEIEKKHAAPKGPAKISRAYFNQLSEERKALVIKHPNRYQIVD